MYTPQLLNSPLRVCSISTVNRPQHKDILYVQYVSQTGDAHAYSHLKIVESAFT